MKTTNLMPATPAPGKSSDKQLADLVHDLANRFMPVLGWLDMGRYVRDEAELRDYWTKASANVPACLALIGQAREALKASAAPTHATCAPGEVLARTLDSFGATLPPTVRVVRSIWPKLQGVPMAAADVDRMVFNLLDNARAAIVEAGRARGTISVLAHNIVIKPGATLPQRGCPPKPGRYVLVAVRDDGPGMSAEVQARMFERGFTTKAPGQGTGIGLASVRDRLSAAGGGITFKSVPGEGTQFNLFLPAIGSDETGGDPTPGLE